MPVHISLALSSLSLSLSLFLFLFLLLSLILGWGRGEKCLQRMCIMNVLCSGIQRMLYIECYVGEALNSTLNKVCFEVKLRVIFEDFKCYRNGFKCIYRLAKDHCL